jgi:DNA-binding NarL/FixJ family response regulator
VQLLTLFDPSTAHCICLLFDEARSLIDRVAARVSLVDDGELRAWAQFWIGFVAVHIDKEDTATPWAAEALAFAERHGLYRLAFNACSLQAASDQFDCNIVRAVYYQRRMAECAAKAGARHLHMVALFNLYCSEAERGNQAALEALDRELKDFDVESHWQGSLPVLRGKALGLAWMGDFRRALETFSGTADRWQWPIDRAQTWFEIAIYAAACGKRDEAAAAVAAGGRQLSRALELRLPNGLTIKSKAFAAVALLLMGKNGLANRRLSSLEATGPCNHALTLLIKAVRSIYCSVEGNRDGTSVEAALEALRDSDYRGYALLLGRLPFPVASQAALGTLTSAETKILRALARGRSSRDIAMATGRSATTINTHVKAVLRKLGCHRRIEAVLLSQQRGLI